jgi:cell division protein FtsW
LAKLALILWGAHVLVVKRALLHRWRHLLLPVVPVALVMFALVMMQPDLGTTITMLVGLLSLLWFAGAPVALFAVVLGGGAAAALALAGVADYRSDRIDAFLNPEAADPKGVAYQANQAIFSLADGGWFGVGLGQGRSKWLYLPNAHNDFIFAIIGEELGLIGCLVVLALLATLAYVGLRIAARSVDPWQRLIAATITTLLVGQAAINIGYVVGLLPVTGLPLPLISSGGTSLVVTMLAFGLLANCARHEPQAVSALQANGQGRLARLLWLPPPKPHRAPGPRRAPRTKAAKPASEAARRSAATPQRQHKMRNPPPRQGYKAISEPRSNGRAGPAAPATERNRRY